MKLTIESFLTEQTLAIVLKQITGSSWVGGQITLPGSRYRFDMAFRDGDATVLVEYDGDAHYRDSLKLKSDSQKDALACANGMRLIRIPYWVQLTTQTARCWFNAIGDISQSFPHGFITTKLFPASFCELGIERFSRELNSLPDDVKDAVKASLRARAAEHGIKYVLPTTLRHLAD